MPAPALLGLLTAILEGDKIDKSEADAFRIAFVLSGVVALVDALLFFVAAKVGEKAIDHRMTRPASSSSDEDLGEVSETLL